MTTKHTPGPWRFYTEPQPNGCPIVGAQGLMIAMLAHTVHQSDQKETALANARLIASSPQMLNALNVALKAFEAISDEMTVGERYTNAGQYLIDALMPVREAIVKATGEQT